MRALRFLLIIGSPALLLAQTPAATKSTAAAKSTTALKSAKSTAAAPAGMTEEQKTIYALGLSLSKSIAPFNLSPAEMELVKKGLADGAAGKPAVNLDTENPKLQALFQTRVKAASEAYLAKAAAEPGAVKTASGLIYKEERAGTGPSPKATDNIKVNYRGTLTNGTEFDSSYSRNQTFDTPLNRVIPCWTEGVQKMKVGGKATLTCPAAIAYGDRGQPPTIPGGATLIFEVELLGINPPAAPLPPGQTGRSGVGAGTGR
jgi:FKBP-type peptidyl-prolyl cis-trans isomerase FkpA